MINYENLDYDAMTEAQLQEVFARLRKRADAEPTMKNFNELQKCKDTLDHLRAYSKYFPTAID